jgi:hypothetical protein
MPRDAKGVPCLDHIPRLRLGMTRIPYAAASPTACD